MIAGHRCIKAPIYTCTDRICAVNIYATVHILIWNKPIKHFINCVSSFPLSWIIVILSGNLYQSLVLNVLLMIHILLVP